MLNVLFLGSGTSTGVPVIGCNCEVCRSTDPRNKRWRSSLLVRSATTTLLVDSCPDLRAQALRHNLTAIDAVLYTHEHLDHTTGFDEMRAFCWRRTERLPLYAGAGCLSMLKKMFGWAFDESNTYQGYIRPAAHDHGGQPFTVGDIEVTPVRVLHATVETCSAAGGGVSVMCRISRNCRQSRSRCWRIWMRWRWMACATARTAPISAWMIPWRSCRNCALSGGW